MGSVAALPVLVAAALATAHLARHLPSLLTGWITALGGAWNISIVAAFMKDRSQTLSTTGLGAAISLATERRDLHVLAAAVGIMAVTVVSFNRLAWRPLSHRAPTPYTLHT